MVSKEGKDDRALQCLRAEPTCVYATDEYGYTALHWAAFEGHVDTADCLLTQGKCLVVDCSVLWCGVVHINKCHINIHHVNTTLLLTHLFTHIFPSTNTYLHCLPQVTPTLRLSPNSGIVLCYGRSRTTKSARPRCCSITAPASTRPTSATTPPCTSHANAIT